VPVDGLDLVGERLHQEGVDSHGGIEEVSDLDPAGFGGEAEVLSSRIQGEAEGILDLESSQVLRVEESLFESPKGVR